MAANTTTSFDVAVGTSRACLNWKNTKMTWAQLCERLTTPIRTAETFAQYRTAKKEEKEKIKDKGGFVGGFIRGGRRLKNSILHRQLIALDADFATAETWPKFKKLFPRLAACCYSTHSHTDENPRLRIIIPLTRPVDVVEYMAASRWLADRIGIGEFDPTTFQPERLMFWPSASIDGDFFAEAIEGPFIDPEAILRHYTDRNDASSWPVSERETQMFHRAAEKQSDPLQKVGLIGSFCRAYYPIETAIEKFLLEKYEPGKGDRWTFKGGTSANGLVIYDEGRFAFSNHGTDPTSGKCCNAFDLVRIHLFGAEDEDAEPGTRNDRLPSYVKMQDFARLQPAVKIQVGKDKVAEAQGDFAGYGSDGEPDETEDGYDGDGTTEKDPDGWLVEMTIDRFGNYEPTIENVVLILQNAPEFKGCFEFNEFKNAHVVKCSLPWRPALTDNRVTDRWDDADSSSLLHFLEKNYGIAIQTKMEHALNVIFRRHRVHPVRDYLNALTWDGRRRVDTLLCDFLGAEDSPYTRAVTRKMLTAAVGRVFAPGVDFQWCVVLIGKEGTGKSTILRKLGGAWFSDSFHTVVGKEAVEQLVGNWIIEVGELAGMNKAEVNVVKHFLSKNTDITRPAYGRHTVEMPRQCVFVATTNESNFLRGAEGNRRFWPVVTGVVEPLFDIFSEMTSEVIGQIWAEAVQYWKDREPLHLAKDLEKTANAVQKEHGEVDDRAGEVEEYLNTLIPANWNDWNQQKRREFYATADLIAGTVQRTQVSAAEVWVECFGKPLPELRRQQSNEIIAILNSFKEWRRIDYPVKVAGYGSQRVFRLKGSDD
jgi:predicted P-loop ATPase